MQKKKLMVIPGRYDAIREVCAFVAREAKAAGLDSQAVFHVELAVDEACTNIVEHAYGGEDKGEIRVVCGIQDSFFVVQLEDHGCSFNPACVESPDLTTELANRQAGGFGMFFMHQIMDRVEFSFTPDRNRLVMYKQMRPKPA